MYFARTLSKFLLTTIIVLIAYSISSQAYAGGVKIIINSGHYDRNYSSGYGDSYRLRNKHYFDNRYRRSYGDRYYGKRYNRNKFYGNNYRYNKRNYYRSNRSYCPY